MAEIPSVPEKWSGGEETFLCRVWGLCPQSLILCDFSTRLSHGKQLGSDPVMLVVASPLAEKISLPGQQSAGWLWGLITLLVSHSLILLFKIGLRIT